MALPKERGVVLEGEQQDSPAIKAASKPARHTDYDGKKVAEMRSCRHGG